MKDKGGRRRTADRRNYTHRDFFPERRATRFRRTGMDRRSVSATLFPLHAERRGVFPEPRARAL
jgi:hypothetical protein